MERTNEEEYHPHLQRFTAAEDIAIQRELDDDYDDDSMDFVDYPEYQPSTTLPSKAPPLNDRLFDLTGNNETVSTMANDNLSVTFQDTLSQDDLPLPTDSIISHDNASDTSNGSVTSSDTHTTPKSTKTSTSVNTRISRVEAASKSTSTDIALLRQDMHSFIKTLNPNFKTTTAPADSHAAGIP